ncbi:MAG: hypothetical protein GY765_38490, partial [bacterium]|nr:hypothetical protein [bacterium]
MIIAPRTSLNFSKPVGITPQLILRLLSPLYSALAIVLALKCATLIMRGLYSAHEVTVVNNENRFPLLQVYAVSNEGRFPLLQVYAVSNEAPILCRKFAQLIMGLIINAGSLRGKLWGSLFMPHTCAVNYGAHYLYRTPAQLVIPPGADAAKPPLSGGIAFIYQTKPLSSLHSKYPLVFFPLPSP